MCGIIGIYKYGNKNVGKELDQGLIALQHRGESAAGIATFQSGEICLKRGKGQVQEIFRPENLRLLKGNIGIGHVRYPTVGGGEEKDAQPFSTNIPLGIAMAHNGNVINYFSLRKELLKTRLSPLIPSKCDVEVILNVFIDKLEQQELIHFDQRNIFKALKGVFQRVRGSFSVVSFIAGQDGGLLAFRDPHGIKPLVFGKRNRDFCFASESVALDALGYDLVRDVKPGEAIFINKKREVISQTIKEAEPRHCIFEYIYFARPDAIIDGLTVYKARLGLGERLAKKVKKFGLKPDVVIPIPDTARATALSLAQTLGVLYREGLIKNRYIGRTFIMPRDVNRAEQVRYKLNPIREEIKGKKVLLVDDSIVRGNTSKTIVSLIRTVKPKAIYLVSSCPPLKYPCYYGIDMQTREDFIAEAKSISEIRKDIGVDELIYQDLRGMIRACGDSNSYCTACFDGNYPIPVSEKEKKAIEKDRGKVAKK